jgi:hypothetical protein
MGRARDISKVFSTNTALATDSEISAFNYLTQASASTVYQTKASAGLTLITPTSVATTGGSATSSISATGTVSFTSASAISLNDVFSATYDNYKIVFELDTMSLTGGNAIVMRLRVGGADNSSANYFNHRMIGQSSSLSGAGASSADTSFISFAEYDNVGITTFMYDIFAPFRTATTSLVGIGQFRYTGFYQHSQLKTGQTTVTTSYTGFTLITTAGTMTGKVRIYGYNQ